MRSINIKQGIGGVLGRERRRRTIKFRVFVRFLIILRDGVTRGHVWMVIKSNSIPLRRERKDVERCCGDTELKSSVVDSQVGFMLRLNHIKYDLQAKGWLESTVTIGLFNERNASFWQRALQCSVDSCNHETTSTSNLGAVYLQSFLRCCSVPPPLPPRSRDLPKICVVAVEIEKIILPGR